MSRTSKVRWTIAVTEPGDVTCLYGVFTEKAQAEKKAAAWQRVLNKRRPGMGANVSIVRIFPDTAETRDRHWPA
jgi:hypothetical protein